MLSTLFLVVPPRFFARSLASLLPPQRLVRLAPRTIIIIKTKPNYDKEGEGEREIDTRSLSRAGRGSRPARFVRPVPKLWARFLCFTSNRGQQPRKEGRNERRKAACQTTHQRGAKENRGRTGSLLSPANLPTIQALNEQRMTSMRVLRACRGGVRSSARASDCGL